QWNKLQPSGRVDLDLSRLEVEAIPGEDPLWRVEGTARFHDVSLVAGPELTELNGTVTGRGELGRWASIDAKADLSRIRVDRRLLRHAHCYIRRPATTNVLRIGDINGRFYSGDLAGEVAIDYTARAPGYDVSLVGR